VDGPPEEIRFDVRGDYNRAILDQTRPVLVNGFRVVVHVPFAGESDIFNLTPSSFDFNPPSAEIDRGELRLISEYPADSPKDVKAEAGGVLDKIEKYLGWSRGDIEGFNEGLEQRARTTIQARRKRVGEEYERLQQSGIPMRKPDDAPKTYIADVLVRRPSPSIPPASASGSIALEPVISDAQFEHILENHPQCCRGNGAQPEDVCADGGGGPPASSSHGA
jgi:hypothetical protein